jgi:hypothetical protein
MSFTGDDVAEIGRQFIRMAVELAGARGRIEELEKALRICNVYKEAYAEERDWAFREIKLLRSKP